MHDPYELGAAGVPYLNQSDYLPIPPGAMGTLFGLSGSRRAYFSVGTAFTARCITAEISNSRYEIDAQPPPPKLNSRRRLHFARRPYWR